MSKVTTALRGMRLLDGCIKVFAIARGTPLWQGKLCNDLWLCRFQRDTIASTRDR